jgi:HEAT repeat protein
VRAAAAHALSHIVVRAEGKTRGEVLAVLRKLADLPDTVLSAPALEALGVAADPDDETRLVTALERADEEVVKAAARALGRRPASARARTALVEALSDRRWDVRRAAAEALGAQGPAAHASLYARRAVEDDPLVLETIDAALQRALEPNS